jgi:hypothetical protein
VRPYRRRAGGDDRPFGEQLAAALNEVSRLSRSESGELADARGEATLPATVVTIRKPRRASKRVKLQKAAEFFRPL